jgi:hypothetical protein
LTIADFLKGHLIFSVSLHSDAIDFLFSSQIKQGLKPSQIAGQSEGRVHAIAVLAKLGVVNFCLLLEITLDLIALDNVPEMIAQ